MIPPMIFIRCWPAAIPINPIQRNVMVVVTERQEYGGQAKGWAVATDGQPENIAVKIRGPVEVCYTQIQMADSRSGRIVARVVHSRWLEIGHEVHCWFSLFVRDEWVRFRISLRNYTGCVAA